MNVHNYVSGNGHQYSANQAWNAADPTLRDRWDGLVQNNGATWRRHFRGYSDSQLQSVPKVTTETGWDSVGNPGGQHTQGTILTNVYLAQFKRGWRYTFVYEMRDGEGGGGNQGLYHGSMPKLAAMYIHNLTTILSDRDALPEPSSLKYVVSHAPNTVHDLLLQKSTGQFELVIWDERVSGEDNVSVDLGEVHRNLNVYDVTAGTTPVQTLANVKSVPLVLSDHAVILEISR